MMQMSENMAVNNIELNAGVPAQAVAQAAWPVEAKQSRCIWTPFYRDALRRRQHWRRARGTAAVATSTGGGGRDGRQQRIRGARARRRRAHHLDEPRGLEREPCLQGCSFRGFDCLS